MLPSGTITDNIAEEITTDRDFKADFVNKRIDGFVDSYEAVKQAIHIAIVTQRYKYPIFSHSYGTDLENVFEDGYIIGVGRVKNAICESLLCDERIKSVENFEFEREAGKVLVKFTAVTTLGDIDMEEVMGNG